MVTPDCNRSLVREMIIIHVRNQTGSLGWPGLRNIMDELYIYRDVVLTAVSVWDYVLILRTSDLCNTLMLPHILIKLI